MSVASFVPLQVCVLLSTYNGARFLPEQLDSVFAQTYPWLRVLARDDGSHDETRSVLRNYSARTGRLRLIEGENVGVIESFHSLLGHPDADADFIAFCDQDDVWLPEKISRAVSALGGTNAPAMYCARVMRVDERLRPLGASMLPRRGPAFENALVENIATGCTIVLNRAGRSLLLESLPSAHVNMHDWWAYLVLSALGQVTFDAEPCLLYRQHGGNAVGAASGARQYVLRVRRLLAGTSRSLASAQAAAFRSRCGDALSAQHRRTLDRFLRSRNGVTRRLRYAASADVWRQTTLDSAVLRCLLAVGHV